MTQIPSWTPSISMGNSSLPSFTVNEFGCVVIVRIKRICSYKILFLQCKPLKCLFTHIQPYEIKVLFNYHGREKIVTYPIESHRNLLKIFNNITLNKICLSHMTNAPERNGSSMQQICGELFDNAGLISFFSIICSILNFKGPITTAANDNFSTFFLKFQKK